MKNKYVMNLHIFENDVNIIDRTGAESLIPVQESNEIIQGIITQSAVLQRGRKLPNMTSKQYKMPVLDAFTFSYDVVGPTGVHRWGNYWMNLPRVSSVPYLASGAVIPPRSEFLAVLGDQKTGNNIEAPEGLLRKIVREESPQKQDGNTYNVSVTASGRKLLNIILEEGELQRSRNGGKNPFKLGEEW